MIIVTNLNHYHFNEMIKEQILQSKVMKFVKNLNQDSVNKKENLLQVRILQYLVAKKH